MLQIFVEQEDSSLGGSGGQVFAGLGKGDGADSVRVVARADLMQFAVLQFVEVDLAPFCSGEEAVTLGREGHAPDPPDGLPAIVHGADRHGSFAGDGGRSEWGGKGQHDVRTTIKERR